MMSTKQTFQEIENFRAKMKKKTIVKTIKDAQVLTQACPLTKKNMPKNKKEGKLSTISNRHNKGANSYLLA